MTLRRNLSWRIGVPALALGFAACGLDIAGVADPVLATSEDASRPTPPDGGAPIADAAEADGEAKAPETCLWPSLQRDAPWPMLGGCVSHRGRTVHRGPKQKPTIAWTITVTTRETQPVIGADGTVFIAANAGGLRAFSPDGGARAMASAGTGQANNVTNAPAIGVDGTLYFGAEHDVVALGPSGPRWRYDTADEVDTSATVDEDGTVYAGSFSDKLSAILPDGGRRWELALGSDVWGSVAIGPTGELYLGALKDLFAVRRDGSVHWRVPTVGDIQSSPVVAEDGTIYIGTLGSRLHAIEPDGGARWTFTTKANFGWQQLPALDADGTIYAPTGSVLAAVYPADGGVKWERDLGVNLRTSVVVDGDGALYVGGDNRMFAYDSSGTRLWDIDIGATASGFAIGRDGTLYVACNGDKLVALVGP